MKILLFLVCAAACALGASEFEVDVDKTNLLGPPWEQIIEKTDPDLAGKKIGEVIDFDKITYTQMTPDDESVQLIKDLLLDIGEDAVIADVGPKQIPMSSILHMGLLMDESSIKGYIYIIGNNYLFCRIHDYTPQVYHLKLHKDDEKKPNK